MDGPRALRSDRVGSVLKVFPVEDERVVIHSGGDQAKQITTDDRVGNHRVPPGPTDCDDMRSTASGSSNDSYRPASSTQRFWFGEHLVKREFGEYLGNVRDFRRLGIDRMEWRELTDEVAEGLVGNEPEERLPLRALEQGRAKQADEFSLFVWYSGGAEVRCTHPERACLYRTRRSRDGR